MGKLWPGFRVGVGVSRGEGIVFGKLSTIRASPNTNQVIYQLDLSSSRNRTIATYYKFPGFIKLHRPHLQNEIELMNWKKIGVNVRTDLHPLLPPTHTHTQHHQLYNPYSSIQGLSMDKASHLVTTIKYSRLSFPTLFTYTSHLYQWDGVHQPNMQNVVIGSLDGIVLLARWQIVPLTALTNPRSER